MDSERRGALCEYLIDCAGESKVVIMVVYSPCANPFGNQKLRNCLTTRAVNLDFQWLLPSFGRVVCGDFVTVPWFIGRITRMSVKICHRNRNWL